uniref:Transmembrane and coiled-coil domain family 2 n=1 Tax=Callorhinchus milii TaxID=7868 RepID=A0A4W3IU54_CALMI
MPFVKECRVGIEQEKPKYPLEEYNNDYILLYLKRIQQVSEGGSSGGMFGHGLKQLFHHRKRSREQRSPEMHRVSYAMSLHDLPARPTAFNRVLQQIRSRPSIKRGASLHSSSRRTKSGAAECQKGSPHLVRKTPQDSSLTAILQQHQYRPRSSSTTDTPIAAAPDSCAKRISHGTLTARAFILLIWS